MQCTRCSGLMVVDSDIGKDNEHLAFGRCVNCGNIEDARIYRNRAMPSGITPIKLQRINFAEEQIQTDFGEL